MVLHLFIACFLMFCLHLIVMLTLFITRVNAVRAKQLDPRYFKTYDLDTPIPVITRQLSRNYINLFESPVLFYAIILLILSLNLEHEHFTFLAYAYVATRFLHSGIHITINKLYPRMFLFFISWVLLATLWLKALLLMLASA